MTMTRGQWLAAKRREVDESIAGGAGYVHGPSMDDVEEAWDAAAEAERARLVAKFRERARQLFSEADRQMSEGSEWTIRARGLQYEAAADLIESEGRVVIDYAWNVCPRPAGFARAGLSRQSRVAAALSRRRAASRAVRAALVSGATISVQRTRWRPGGLVRASTTGVPQIRQGPPWARRWPVQGHEGHRTVMRAGTSRTIADCWTIVLASADGRIIVDV